MLNTSGIIENSIVDGQGIRYVVFVQGCPHHCEGCHNPDTWEFRDNKFVEIDTIVDTLKDDFLCQGITFSGGEPFMQAIELIKLADKIHALNKDVWCYTGYTIEQLLSFTDDKRELLNHIDVLVDGRFELAERNTFLHFRGSNNQRVIDVKKTLQTGEITLKEGI